jgi:hypothetical protein
MPDQGMQKSDKLYNVLMGIMHDLKSKYNAYFINSFEVTTICGTNALKIKKYNKNEKGR